MKIIQTIMFLLGKVVSICLTNKLELSIMEQIKCDARGSARVFKGPFMLVTNSNMTVDDAMKAAEFTK